MSLLTRRGDRLHARAMGPLGPSNGARRRSGALSTVAAAGRTLRVLEAVEGSAGAALAPPVYS
jgi:hypothetical protein